MTQKAYRVLLYYQYVTIDDPETFAAEHLAYCKNLGIKGRILVAHEGINGTVSGTVEQTEAYMEHVRSDERFKDMAFKIDEADKHAFKKMHVRPRPEIVNSSLNEHINPNRQTGRYLEPEEFRKALEDDDVVIIDARNDYEYDIGHFRNAIRPDIKTFRELPQWIKENLADQKDKKILTYCTGGIRCEKFTGFLIDEGFKDVNQLHGGIVTYGKDEKVQGELYDGKCFVFDERMSVPVNQKEDVVVGKCYHCGKAEDRYVNCANPECNRLYVCCEECEPKYRRSCSDDCRTHGRNRYVDPEEPQSQQVG
ncbi:rhodanese-related sulfurtransferase [Bacillaceae bacterium SIJ1]|uniref:oxygen-dependent tRNA uridine(34) hydroxylase TrhO n=1 Tax=Litoribacterium kuwaitense TaxID=1398745 RepID=UPI0013E9DC4F|nr:rhodanese-related sulfurtransferase [Litoribacterium kuwaitense]NGP43981.1 rhodanese-related sulfurtransferase [Litoribacterium kuwaitense]